MGTAVTGTPNPFLNIANWQKSLTEYSLFKLAAWAPTGSPIFEELPDGSIVYNSTARLLRRKLSSLSWETVPYLDGAIYQYDGNLYIWNGTDLELKSTFKQEIEKDSTETTAVIRSTDGQIIVNPAYTYDVVDKYYTYGGGIFAVVCRQIVSTETGSISVAAYNKNNIFLKGYYQTFSSSVASSSRNLYNVLVDLPQNTAYVKIHGNNNEGEAMFCETKLYALSLVDMSARQAALNELDDKLIKLAAWAPSGSPIFEELSVGSIVYNTTTRLLRKKIAENTFETVPYLDGAIYTYNSDLYIWNGTDLELKSTFKQEIEKDSTETTAVIRSTDGQIIVNPAYTYDVVDKYYTYGGGIFAVVCRQIVSTETGSISVAAYNKNNIFLKGYYQTFSSSVASSSRNLYNVLVDLPQNTAYVKIHGNNNEGEAMFCETKLYALSLVDMSARQAIAEITGDSPVTYTPEECRVRFYKAMEEKCANLEMSGYIIEGGCGYDRYNGGFDGGQVENPILGHGQSVIPITGMCRIIANSLNYPFFANLWSEKEHVIKAENTDFSYTLTRTIDEHFSEQLESEYIILGWKTGTKQSGGEPWYTNLLCAATNYNLQGKVLAGYVHLALNPTLEDETTNRCKAMKILFNIGETLLQNRSADVSTLQTQLIGQQVAHAEVMVYPSYAAFMSNFNAAANTDYRLYHYYNDNSNLVNTYSTIKVLVSQIVLDYTFNLEEVVTITDNDIYWAPYSGNIFTAGQQYTIRNLLYAYLMISSSQAGQALMRVVGEKILKKYGTEGFIPPEPSN